MFLHYLSFSSPLVFANNVKRSFPFLLLYFSVVSLFVRCLIRGKVFCFTYYLFAASVSLRNFVLKVWHDLVLFRPDGWFFGDISRSRDSFACEMPSPSFLFRSILDSRVVQRVKRLEEQVSSLFSVDASTTIAGGISFNCLIQRFPFFSFSYTLWLDFSFNKAPLVKNFHTKSLFVYRNSVSLFLRFYFWCFPPFPILFSRTPGAPRVSQVENRWLNRQISTALSPLNQKLKRKRA